MTPIPTHICLFKKEEEPDGDVFLRQDVYRPSTSVENVGDDGKDVTTRRHSWSGNSKRGNEVDKGGEGGEYAATRRWLSLGNLFSKRNDREINGWMHNSRLDQEADHNVIR